MARTVASYSFNEISSGYMKYWRIIATLPFDGHSLHFIKSRLLRIDFMTMILFWFTSYIGYGIRMLVNHRFENDFVCELATVMSVTGRYFMALMKRGKLVELVDMSEQLWNNLREGESQAFSRFERKVRVFRDFTLWITMTVLAAFILTSQFIRLPPTSVNGTDRRILPIRFYVDVQREPQFTLVRIAQGIMGIHISLTLTGIETYGPWLIMMACGFMKSVQNRFLLMANSEHGLDIIQNSRMLELSGENVTDCIKFHQKILKFCNMIEDFTRSFFMVTVMCSLYALSLIGIQIIANNEYLYGLMTLLILNTYQLYICQWGAQQLLNESVAVGQTAYFAALTGFHFDRRCNKMLMVVLMRSQKPVQLTAGGYFKLSIESFGHNMECDRVQ
ncbi:hypothetical protein QAD02_009140 [Eretmocerus hayati]|uniref:Uncharacterized protein n=1 Tax=Eretmocerus hayati TaxID=131215 RepID=A0ACC2N8S5_9HYME|nr:hypothetical protein QAD02_009140 [Eretmocerus hayati]